MKFGFCLSPLLFFCCIACSSAQFDQTSGFEMKKAENELPFKSEDGSMIRNGVSMGNVQSVFCSLPPGQIIQASRHRTVSQIWYVSSGTGQMWLRDLKGKEILFAIGPGTSFNVPLGYAFQFLNDGANDLNIFIVNTTPWSNSGELIPIGGH